MARQIRRCPKCDTYTMVESCPTCSGPTYEAKPPKYSPQDKYAAYRRQAKKELETSSK